jgi:heme oxygenase
MPSRVIERLDARTRGASRISDIRWSTLAATASVDRYRNHLIDVYGFEAAVEAAIVYSPDFATVVDRRPYTRSGLVAADLLTLGLTPVEIANLAQYAITPFAGPATALGWWYVLDRSTRQFAEWQARLAIQMPGCDAFAYLGMHRRNAIEEWNELCALLDRTVTSLEMEADVITAAADALDSEHAWYRRARP